MNTIASFSHSSRRGISTGGAIAIGLIAVLLSGFFSIVGYFNSINSEGVKFETELSNLYSDNQNDLSSYVLKMEEALGIAGLKTDKVHQVLVDAVGGRYTGGKQGQGGQLFSALVEAYPALDWASIYDKLVDMVNAGRDEFRNRQSHLLDRLRAYKSWLGGGDSTIFHSWAIRWYGFPSQSLEARIGDQVVTGKAALNQMSRIITDDRTDDTYRNGKQKPIEIPTSGQPNSGK